MAGSSGEVRDLITALRTLERGLRRETRQELTKAAEPLRRDAQTRAERLGLTRVSRAVRVRVSFAARDPGISLTVSDRLAPHGRLYEFGSKKLGHRAFMHPVFGDRTNWKRQEVRPSLTPALRASREDVLRGFGQAIDRAAERAGWKR